MDLKGSVNPTIRAILAHFSDPIESKKFDFSRNPMGMPLIIFWGLKTDKKRGFYSIFVDGGDDFRIMKFGFLAFYEAKLTKIGILDQKLIVPNDYQEFWVHFEWFLSLFQISDVK